MGYISGNNYSAVRPKFQVGQPKYLFVGRGEDGLVNMNTGESLRDKPYYAFMEETFNKVYPKNPKEVHVPKTWIK